MASKKKGAVKIKNILSHSSSLKDRFIPSYPELKRTVRDLKRMGYTIVLTQGVFDMLHEGHARYLEKALSHGDLLIVGVDSDALTRKRKGSNRPIVPQEERLHMLAHLRSVGILATREVNQDIGALIKCVEPDVLITSASTKDFTKKEATAYKTYCKKVVMLPPQAATSTTARVRLLTINGADQLAQDIMIGVPALVENALKKFRG
jgi:D-beta-D-heptose 7-phosphate kinase/D-beta-D-heptose 1-phosphate adenosyltransferase